MRSQAKCWTLPKFHRERSGYHLTIHYPTYPHNLLHVHHILEALEWWWQVRTHQYSHHYALQQEGETVLWSRRGGIKWCVLRQNPLLFALCPFALISWQRDFINRHDFGFNVVYPGCIIFRPSSCGLVQWFYLCPTRANSSRWSSSSVLDIVLNVGILLHLQHDLCHHGGVSITSGSCRLGLFLTYARMNGHARVIVYNIRYKRLCWVVANFDVLVPLWVVFQQ